MFHFILLFLFSGAILASPSSPKKYQNDDGYFQPSNRYYESNINEYTKLNSTSSLSSSSSSLSPTAAESKINSKDDRLRFGALYNPSANGNQYGNNGGGGGVGYMINPLKIDIGGIALGALIGLGAILIVPKLAHIFSAGYGYRSLENDMSSITNVLERIDNSLEQHNIDSNSCIQRIICTYVNDAKKNVENGEANTADELIFALSNNPLLSYVMDGTTIKEAVDIGKRNSVENCLNLFTKCPISKDNLLKVVSSLLPA